MWDYLFDLNPNNPPSNKESPCKLNCKLNYLHIGDGVKIKCSIEIQLFTAWVSGTPYVKYLQSWSLLYEHHCQISREPNSFTRAYCAFCASGVGRSIAPLRH